MEENGAASQSVSGSKPSVEANGTSNAAAAPATALTTKIYIGGLPDTTSVDDLRDCFGQLGGVKNIDLKKGFGFVDYEDAQSASDAVAKYHEGTFLGSPIKVELSHGGRYRDLSHDSCYACGGTGHWARDCPKAPSSAPPRRRRSPSPGPARSDRYARPARERSPRSSYAPPSSRDPYDRPPPRDIRDARDPRDARDYYDRPPPPQEDPYDRREPASATAWPRDRDGRDRYGAPPPALDRGYAGPPDDRRYRDPSAPDLRDRLDPRGLPPAPASRDPYAPSGGREYYEDYRREDVYAARAAPPAPVSDPYGYPAPRDPYDRAAPAAAYSRGYAPPAPDPAYSRSAYDSRGGPPPPPPPPGRYDDRPAYDDRDRREPRPVADRVPTRDYDRRDVPPYASERERSPARRPSYRRSLSPPPRRTSATNGASAYPPAAAPPYAASNARGPPVDDYRRGSDYDRGRVPPPPVDDYRRGPPANAGYGRDREPYGRR